MLGDNKDIVNCEYRAHYEVIVILPHCNDMEVAHGNDTSARVF